MNRPLRFRLLILLVNDHPRPKIQTYPGLISITHWAEKVSFNLPGPGTFTLLSFKHNRNERFCEQPCWVCPVFAFRTKPSEEKGENKHFLLPLPFIRITNPPLGSCFFAAGPLTRVAQRRRGERMSFYTNRGSATFVFELGL